MTVFIIVAAAMVAAALAWVLVPLLRSPGAEGVDRETSNVAILRDQLAELETDLANGNIPRPQYEQAKRELEQRVLEESKAMATAKAAPPPRAGAWAAAVLGGLLPIAALGLYVGLGNHEAFSPAAQMAAAGGGDGQHDLTPAKVEEMAASLATKLERDPGNGEGWIVLARTYNSMGRFPEAVRAYEKAVALIPDDAGLYADYADALAATQKGLAGKPMELVERALKLDPTQWKALALAGTYAFDRRDFRQAVEYWEKMKATVPPGSPLAQSIDGSIAEARSLGNITTAVVPAKPSATAAAPAAPAARAAPAAPAPASTAKAPAALPGTTIGGTVTLSPTLAARAAPGDSVFIFARPAEGARMPLAIIRTTVKDLPARFTLDDSMAMTPEMRMSNFAEIVVGARVSKSGNAVPASGDLEGFSKPVKIGASGINVVIDTQRP